ncbi:hypothetical protein GCM10010207_15880 [Streptomyces atratus]|nr:hypothetical protein GCM10010207_15880 [Streptomyces atratus]
MMRMVPAEVPKRLANAAHTPPIMRPSRGRASAAMVGSFVNRYWGAAPSCSRCIHGRPANRGKASLYGAIPTLGIVGVDP